MGWWPNEKRGKMADGVTGMVWGDGPAAVMSKALEDVDGLFLKSRGRFPTVDELRAGFEFALVPRIK